MADITVSQDVHEMLQAENAAAIKQAIGIDDGLMFQSVASMLASTTASVGEGTIWEAESHKYREASSGATDYHMITAGSVKLYCVPDSDGWITTEQLGWADDFECRDELFRFVPSLPAYSKLLICHKLAFTPTSAQVTLPEGFTLAAKRKKRDGFHFPEDAPNAFRVFWVSSHAYIDGLEFTADAFTIDKISGAILFAQESVPRKTGINIINCVFNVPCNTPVYLQRIEDTNIIDCEFLDGQYPVYISTGGDRWVVDSCKFKSGTFTNSEQLKTIYGDGPSRFCRIINCDFIESYRDGIDTTGSIQDSIIENCRFVRCGGGPDGSSGVGFGGIDFKINQEDEAAKKEPTARVYVNSCWFEDSVCRSTSDWTQGTWSDPTTEERNRWGIHNIWFANNVFIKTGNNSLPCDTRVEQSVMNGDTFLGGAKFMTLPQSARNIIWENSVAHVYQGQSSSSIHFSLFFDPTDGAEPGNIMLDNCVGVTISGRFAVNASGSVFRVRNSGGGSDNIVFSDCSVMSQGGKTFLEIQHLADQDDNGTVVIRNCYFEKLSKAVSVSGGTLDCLIVSGSTWIEGVVALINYATLANTPVINRIYSANNVSDGGTLEAGTETGIVTKTVSGNVGFV